MALTRTFESYGVRTDPIVILVRARIYCEHLHAACLNVFLDGSGQKPRGAWGSLPSCVARGVVGERISDIFTLLFALASTLHDSGGGGAVGPWP